MAQNAAHHVQSLGHLHTHKAGSTPMPALLANVHGKAADVAMLLWQQYIAWQAAAQTSCCASAYDQPKPPSVLAVLMALWQNLH